LAAAGTTDGARSASDSTCSSFAFDTVGGEEDSLAEGEGAEGAEVANGGWVDVDRVEKEGLDEETEGEAAGIDWVGAAGFVNPASTSRTALSSSWCCASISRVDSGGSTAVSWRAKAALALW